MASPHRGWVHFLLTLLTIAALLLGCDEGGSSKTQPAPDSESPSDESPSLDVTKLSADCFEGGEERVFEQGSGFAGATWNDPHVIRAGDEWWLYMSANTSFSGAVQIYRWTSSDGESWTLDPATPVLTEGGDGAWDDAGVETPAVVRFQDQYHLFYTGYDVTGDAFAFKIGHAVSDDGVNWDKDASYLLAPGDVVYDFAQLLIGEPGPAVQDGTLYLYFTTVGADLGVMTTLQVIGVTTTDDGVNWSTPVSALRPDQDVYPRGDDWIGYSTPNAIALDDGVHLFVDVAHQPDGGEWLQMRLHHARSANGISGWISDSEPIHAREDFSWTQREIRSPAPYLDGLELKLFFAGDDLFSPTFPGPWGIGRSSCDLSSD